MLHHKLFTADITPHKGGVLSCLSSSCSANLAAVEAAHHANASNDLESCVSNPRVAAAQDITLIFSLKPWAKENMCIHTAKFRKSRPAVKSTLSVTLFQGCLEPDHELKATTPA